MQHVTHVNDQLSAKDLFDDFKLQLAKDFQQSNFETGFIEDLQPDYNHILEKIVLELQRSEKRADSDVLQLLYRIDISESQLEKYLNKDNNKNHWMTIAELIIKRVLQKVVTKRFYKKNENL
ncbi:MAG: hypothetical protein RH948_11355 [Cyclobacteriaceae bacterium]